MKYTKIILGLLLACLCISCRNTPAETVPEESVPAAAPEIIETTAEPDTSAEETAETEPVEDANQLSIPQLHLSLQMGAVATEYRPAEYRIIDKDGQETTVSGTIKIRGNSTSGGAKKPFNIKLESKTSILGMKKSKRWVLIANCFDKTMLRNKMAFDFAENLNLEFTPDSMFVDVYVAGKYQGVYLLCEDITVDKSRVNIKPENGDFLIELESVRNEGGEIYINSISGMRFKVKEPEPEELTTEQKDEVSKFLLQCDVAAASKNFEKISAIFDIDSFVDMYLFKEVYKDVDGKYSSLFFYIKDGKIYAGPVWDNDLCCGNASIIFAEDKYQSYHNVPGYEGTGSRDSADGIWMQFGWFRLLMQCEKFENLVIERYKELYPLIKNQFTDNELGQNRIDAMIEEYTGDIERNNAVWDVSVERAPYEWHPMLKNYEDYVIFYRNWFIRRINFLNGYFGVEDTLPEESPYTTDTGE